MGERRGPSLRRASSGSGGHLSQKYQWNCNHFHESSNGSERSGEKSQRSHWGCSVRQGFGSGNCQTSPLCCGLWSGSKSLNGRSTSHPSAFSESVYSWRNYFSTFAENLKEARASPLSRASPRFTGLRHAGRGRGLGFAISRSALTANAGSQALGEASPGGGHYAALDALPDEYASWARTRKASGASGAVARAEPVDDPPRREDLRLC